MTRNRLRFSAVPRIVACLSRHRGSVVVTLAATLGAIVLTAFLPLLPRLIIDEVIVGRTRPLAPWAGLLVISGLLLYALNFIRRYWAGRLAVDVQHDLREQLFGSVLRLDGAQQAELSTGQLLVRSTSDLQLVFGALSAVPTLLGSVVLLLVAALVMTALSPVLMLVTLGTMPLLWYCSYQSVRWVFPASWLGQRDAAAVADVVGDAVGGVAVVKGFGQERQELEKLRARAERLFATRMRLVRVTARYVPASQAVPALGQLAILAVGGWMVLRGMLSLGTFVAFNSYLAMVVGPAKSLLGMVALSSQALAGLARIFQIIDLRPSVAERGGELACAGVTAPSVEFDDVRFQYGEGPAVLEGFQLSCPAGTTLALVGATGSGKTTAVSLLLRHRDPSSGVVRIEGRDIRSLSLSGLRSLVGVVSGEPFILAGSVRENIAFSQPEATLDEVIEAARLAHCHEFISQLPDGYEEMIGSGGRPLSGGQRQRIAVARALLADPKVLVLDGAASALDSMAAWRIHTAVAGRPGKRTTIIVTHQPSLLRLADRIAVLDSGRVVDEGTYAELLARSEAFRTLVGDPASAGAAPLRLGPSHSPSPAAVPSWPYGSGGPPATPGEGERDGPRHGLAALALTPRLRAQLDALPPATDRPRQADGDPGAPLSPASLLREYKAPALLVVALALADGACALALPLLVRHGVDAGVQHALPHVLWTATAVGAAVVAAQWAVQTTGTRTAGRTSERMLYAVRVRLFNRLQRLQLDFYEREPAGLIITRMTTDVEALAAFAQTGLTWTIASSVSFAGILIVLIAISARLAIAALAAALLLVIATVHLQRRSLAAYHEARKALAVASDYVHECMRGLAHVQAWCRENECEARHSALSRAFRDRRLQFQLKMSAYYPLGQLLASLATAGVLTLGMTELRQERLSLGTLVAFLLYLELLFAPAQQAALALDGLQQAKVSMTQIQSLPTANDIPNPRSSTVSADPSQDAGPVGPAALELDNVCFSYPRTSSSASRPVLQDVSLTIQRATTVAFVGESGAGKTTLLKLIAGLCEPDTGRVLVDGTNLREIPDTVWRQRLGIVPQEPYLFAGTVREAIAYGRADATDHEVEQAARVVGAHDVISRLPDGYHHRLDPGGTNLAAGQRQLISLARAALVQPSMLLLDEATAALDDATEQAVAQALAGLSRDCTVLVVAHRPATAARADRIVVLDRGRVVEYGHHEELLAAGGTYARMWESWRGSHHDALYFVTDRRSGDFH
ncbi:ABC transporter ATP-binding protein [Streptomyces mirabilis]|uniref:ABC transporter ATP-binding protein n=1 Tax=Streptomyces mirabilis TaxID=68239 RepID=UPI0033CDEEC5